MLLEGKDMMQDHQEEDTTDDMNDLTIKLNPSPEQTQSINIWNLLPRLQLTRDILA